MKIQIGVLVLVLAAFGPAAFAQTAVNGRTASPAQKGLIASILKCDADAVSAQFKADPVDPNFGISEHSFRADAVPAKVFDLNGFSSGRYIDPFLAALVACSDSEQGMRAVLRSLIENGFRLSDYAGYYHGYGSDLIYARKTGAIRAITSAYYDEEKAGNDYFAGLTTAIIYEGKTASKDWLELLDYFLEQKFDPNVENNRWSPWFILVGQGADMPDLVQNFLDHGADPNINMLGNRPLTYAAVNCKVQTVEKLIAAGADPLWIRNDGETYLLVAASVGCAPLVERFLKLGVDRNRAGNFKRQTALELAQEQASFNRLDQPFRSGEKRNFARVIELLSVKQP